MAADAAGVKLAVLVRLVEARAEHRRRAVADAMLAAGVDAQVEGEAVRLSGRGLLRRWMNDLGLREAGRGG